MTSLDLLTFYSQIKSIHLVPPNPNLVHPVETSHKYLPLDERQGGRPGHGRRLGPAGQRVVLGLGGRAGPAHHRARQLHLQGRHRRQWEASLQVKQKSDAL